MLLFGFFYIYCVYIYIYIVNIINKFKSNKAKPFILQISIAFQFQFQFLIFILSTKISWAMVQVKAKWYIHELSLSQDLRNSRPSKEASYYLPFAMFSYVTPTPHYFSSNVNWL